MSRRSEEQNQARSRGRPEALPKRWSAQRRAEVAQRLLRGEDIGKVTREIQVAPPELERWRRVFLDGGQPKNTTATSRNYAFSKPPLRPDKTHRAQPRVGPARCTAPRHMSYTWLRSGSGSSSRAMGE